MTISSAQLDCSITSSNLDTITLTDTITINNSSSSSYYYTTGGGTGGFSSDTITISGGGAGSTYTIGAIGAGSGGFSTQGISAIDPSIFTWKTPEEFVDAFPDFERIKKMCEQYPGLKIAYEKFVTTYKLVKDDYDTPEDQRPKP